MSDLTHSPSDLVRAMRVERLARMIHATQKQAAKWQLETVKAQEPDAKQKLLDAHDRLRDHAQSIYQSVVDQTVAVAAADAIEVAHAKEKKKKTDRDLGLLFLLLMEDAEERGYRGLSEGLSGLEPPLTHPPYEAQWKAAQEFAKSRREYLKDFPNRAQDRINKEVETGASLRESPYQIAERIRKCADAIKTGEGRIVAETEAEISYGTAQFNVLKAAGYEFKIWETCHDERVRKSHRNCNEQGPIPMDQKFLNGMLYPGDPAGEVSELINCRCFLCPGKKHDQEPVKSSDKSGHGITHWGCGCTSRCRCGCNDKHTSKEQCPMCKAGVKQAAKRQIEMEAVQ